MYKEWISSEYCTGLVSVIIPTYNRSSLLTEAVESVINQSYRPIECIVVDDGSTDNTKEVVKQLINDHDQSDSSINYLYQENSGAPAARNYGTQYSKGEFIQYLDSDDFLYPDKINDQVTYLNTYPGCDGVFGDWHKGTTTKNEIIKAKRDNDLIDQFYGGRVIHTLSMLYTRRIIQNIGPWDIELKRNQEIDFNLRGALLGGNFAYLPGVTGLWRDHESPRIVSQNGAIHALKFHEKWISEFLRLGLLDEKRRKTAASFLQWHSMELGKEYKKEAILYLIKAKKLYPELPELNSPKFNCLIKIIGIGNSIRLWYLYANSESRSKKNKK